MKACGIVAEYNPFHNGHAYQIEQIRRELKPDVVIAVMSGNFLQRGEPALVDKWTRTKMAIAGGVDLVVELPVAYSTQPADFFAKGAIEILGALDIDAISFGVESGSAADFLRGASWLFENEGRIESEIKKTTAFDVPYAKQMEQMITKLAPDFPLHLNSPNNQLGFAYAKEIVRQGFADTIELKPLNRSGAGYDDRQLSRDSHIASATAIRLARLKGEDVSAYIPKKSMPYFAAASNQMVTWDDYFPLLQYQLTVQSEADLREIYQMTEGLENRLKAQIQAANDFQTFMEKIQTKRYTQTRLQRLLTYTLLQFSHEDIENAWREPSPIRVLGFTDQGQKYLRHKKHTMRYPLISNVNQGNAKELSLGVLAGKIYRLGKSHLLEEQDFTQKPVKID